MREKAEKGLCAVLCDYSVKKINKNQKVYDPDLARIMSSVRNCRAAG